MVGKPKIQDVARNESWNFSRRGILAGMTAGVALLATGRAARAACALTPFQVDGPFYPMAIEDYDWDLTSVSGKTGRAEGDVIEVTGQVLDVKCQPLPGSVLEVWQANLRGRYNHPGDKSTDRPLDPNFQGYARIVTDKDGRYRFLTIIPGSYPAIGDWVRPRHIHFKVHAPFNPPVNTQMYFAGEPLNDKDLLLAPLSPEQRASLEVSFDTVRADGIRTGVFNPILAEGWTPPEGLVMLGAG